MTGFLVFLVFLGIKQPMHVHHEVAHVGVVDSLLRLRLPGSIGGRVVRIDADDIQLVEILEFDVAQILELTTKDKMIPPAAQRDMSGPVPR